MKEKQIVQIDHHASHTRFGAYSFIDVGASSTTMVLYKLFTELNITISKQMARNMLTGIITDSGVFSFATTSPDTLRIAADLIERGADHYDIIYKLTFNKDPKEFSYATIIYNNLVVNERGRYAYSSRTQEELKAVGISDNDMTGLPAASDLIKRVAGVDFVFVVAQEEDGSFTVSIRSSIPNFNSGLLAQKLGGGGHFMAAGVGSLETKSVQETVELVLSKKEELGEALYQKT